MISVICPAKLNLGLKVLGRRPDGFHDLDGLMVGLPWFDRVDVEMDDHWAGPPNEQVDLVLSGDGQDVTLEAPQGADNIVVRAAREFLARAADRFGGFRPRVTIRLIKRIPSGTGLGGASSDAAGTLLALNGILTESGLEPFSDDEIRVMAACLGSDTVFFLDPEPARIQGRGERFVPAGVDVSLAVVVAVPSTRLSTATVFALWDERRDSDGTNRNRLTVSPPGAINPCLSVSASARSGFAPLPEFFENDLSDAVFELCPRAAELSRLLVGCGASVAAVTGSGAAVYGVCGDMVSARAVAAAMSRVILPGEIARAFQVGNVF